MTGGISSDRTPPAPLKHDLLLRARLKRWQGKETAQDMLLSKEGDNPKSRVVVSIQRVYQPGLIRVLYWGLLLN